MDSGDVMKVEVYKKMREHWKRHLKKKRKRRKNIERKE